MKYDLEFLENYWMPFTSNRDFKADPRLVVRAEGVYMLSLIHISEPTRPN